MEETNSLVVTALGMIRAFTHQLIPQNSQHNQDRSGNLLVMSVLRDHCKSYKIYGKYVDFGTRDGKQVTL